ncbi:hypothetical protein V1J52_19440 [Streptomyces sp. TRM 70351]|uniref:hypothetical protein n=1 Tax=Streptomyces sp. TRM 70351 TaxID=3116552 RepID=UPI002E7B5BF9|nr:hypothetical protein [Streptomyces sp. TRM 70351]MEE1930329.1 hypothetical protein [Streptomyces sp. TRM 70351]
MALLLLDLLVIAALVYGYAISGWADSYDGNGDSSAPEVAWQGMWILAGGAVVTGGGLLALRWRVAATAQVLVLGAGAALLAFLAQSA